MPAHRSLSEIQADLTAAYAKRSQLLRAGAQSVTTPAAGSTTFLNLAEVEDLIASLKTEYAEAEAALRSAGCCRPTASGFGVIQVEGPRDG